LAFPAALPHRAALATGLVLASMVIHLQGVCESGAVFSVPACSIVLAICLMGGIRYQVAAVLAPCAVGESRGAE